MRNKNEISYQDVFEHLIVKADEFGYSLNPSVIICDYEQAAHSAARNIFNDVRIQGCFFHLGQSLFRKIQAEGLANRYVKEENFALNLRKLWTLAFLPSEEIKDAFDQVVIC